MSRQSTTQLIEFKRLPPDIPLRSSRGRQRRTRPGRLDLRVVWRDSRQSSERNRNVIASWWFDRVVLVDPTRETRHVAVNSRFSSARRGGNAPCSTRFAAGTTALSLVRLL